jgi:hypothetical protein
MPSSLDPPRGETMVKAMRLTSCAPWRSRSAGKWLLAGLALAGATLTTVPARAQMSVAYPPLNSSGQMLVGAGVRHRWGVPVYSIALYADMGRAGIIPPGDGEALIRSPATKTVDIRMLRTVSAAKMRRAMDSALARMRGTQEHPQFLSYFDRPLAAGSSVVLTFSGPTVGVTIDGRVMPSLHSEAFASALLGVWIGPRPLSRGLRHSLLRGLGRMQHG